MGLVHTLECDECKSSYRLESLGKSLVAGLGSFCPNCGSQHTSKTHRTGEGEEYFWALAESIGLPKTEEGAAITKLLYDEWDTVKYKKFVDFVKAFETEGGEE